ncbi:MAG: OmpA family protein [Bacteroidales bacterium]|nr:OmpA family protein [Bacteroidales bacterium]
MKNRYSLILIVLLSLLIVPQGVVKAQKNFAGEADKKFELHKYYDAIQLYKKAYTKVKGNKLEKNRILFQIGRCYYYVNDMKKASLTMKRVVSAKYPEPDAHYIYGDALKAMGEYEDALIAFQEFKKTFPDDIRADIGIESCNMAVAWMDNPTRYEVEPNRKLNSRNADFAPSYYDKKHKALMFTTSREEVYGRGTDSWTGLPFTDFFVVSKDRKGNWGTPVPLDEEGVINSEANEGAGTFDPKFRELYFTRCQAVKKKKMGCEIYVAVKKGRTWSEPEVITLAADSFTVGHPAMIDENTMIFASNMPGGEGGRDLWMVKRPKKNKPFEKAENLGNVINTPGDELYPTIRLVGDHVYMYFSTNGRAGMGGLDIFKTELIDGKWTEPENMKYPINSNGDDFHMIFSDLPDDLKEADAKEMGWFTTNRKGGRGNDDIWSFRMPPILFTLTGIVRDDSTKEIIVGALVQLEGSDGTVLQDSTDATGSYYFDNTQILEETTYRLNVSKVDYYSEKGKETTVGLIESKDLVHDFNLVPIPKKPIVLPDILYDFNKWDLKPQYQDSLLGLVQIMKENPNLIIELGSHTDVRGSDEFNDTLSFKRAKSCVDYIVTEQGIEPDRIKPKGYGERVPRLLQKDKTVIFEGDTFFFEKGLVMTEEYINGLSSRKEQEAAHQLNRRTTFEIVGTDYVPQKDTNTPIDPKIEIINNDGDDNGDVDNGEEEGGTNEEGADNPNLNDKVILNQDY